MADLRYLSLLLSALILAQPNMTYAAPISHEMRQVQLDQSTRNADATLKYLVPILLQANKAGRIYYAADCPSNIGTPYDPYPFPDTKAQPPSEDASGLTAVKEIFQNNENVVEENPPGIIKVRIGKIADDFLNIHIYGITVPKHLQYDPESAIEVIETSKEVLAAMRKLDLGNKAIYDGHFQGPRPGLPHLSAPFTKVTVDQALDVVAQTFGGIVVYGVCTNQHYYGLGFLSVAASR